MIGSGATEIGVGSQGSVDGAWTQIAGGVLRPGLDSGGVTPILVDDVDDDGAGAQGNVTFESGAILDPYDAGGANNAWTPVMTWEGTLTDNGLALSAAATSAGWEMRVVGSTLEVRNPSFPDPVAGVAGDFNGDGIVDCDDMDGYVNNLDVAAVGALAPLDIDGDMMITADDAELCITTLVVTQPNGVTGTALGDLNCDGSVSVLGDAFALVGSCLLYTSDAADE